MTRDLERLAEHQVQLLLPAPARLLATPLATSRDSNDSSNDDDRARKKRKKTYATRKEEVESMRLKMDRLSDELSDLTRHRHDQGRDARNRRATDSVLALNSNEYMRSLVQQQQQVLVGIHSTLSDWMNDGPFTNPVTSFIHLRGDNLQRHTTLMAMKQQKLVMAEQFLRSRNHQRSLLRPYNVTSQSETERGDFCCVHEEIVQFKCARSAREAYDALMATMANMEISVSEKLGDITVLEDSDTVDDGVANYRMLTWANATAPQESNNVVFTQFYENQKYDEFSDGDGYGVTVMDFVDRDDQYPYRPDQNIRRDTTIVSTISTHRDPKNPHKRVVVIQRASFLKIHSSNLIRDESVLAEMRKGIIKWCDVCYCSMQENIAMAQNAPIPEVTPL